VTAIYEVQLQPDEAAWLATAPAFAEVVTFGTTPEEAVTQARKAIEEAIAARIAAGEALPLPLTDTPATGHFVDVAAEEYRPQSELVASVVEQEEDAFLDEVLEDLIAEDRDYNPG